MGKLKIIVITFVFLAASVGVISRYGVVKETVDVVGEEYAGTLPCMGPGFCIGYGYSFDGKLDSQWRFRPNCQGTQAAILQDVFGTKTYKSGSAVHTKRVRVVRTTGSCEVGGMVNENRSRDI